MLVTHRASGGGYDRTDTVAVTVTDDEAAGLVVSDSSVTVSEAGGTATYVVGLATQPTGDVTVTAASSDTSAAVVSPTVLTFTTTEWDVAQTVTVTGVRDGIPGNRAVTVTHSASGGGYDLSDADTVAVEVIDAGVPGLVVSRGSVTVAEAGGMATYTLALAARPSDADVTVVPASSDTAAAVVSPTVLTFTLADWNVARTVTVTGVDDIGLGDRRALITHAASGGGYDLTDADTVSVTVTDDDAASLVVSDTAVAVAEAGGTATYTVALSVRPTDAVRVTAASSDASAAVVSPATLTFTTADWDAPRTVTVTGVDDNALGDRRALVTHAAGGGGYDLTDVDTVAVTVTDDDAASLVGVGHGGDGGGGGRDGDLHGGAVGAADGSGDGDVGEFGRGRGDGVAGGADVHGRELGRAADGDGDGG